MGHGHPKCLLERRGPRVSSSWPARHILAPASESLLSLTPGRHRVDKDERAARFWHTPAVTRGSGATGSSACLQHQRTHTASGGPAASNTAVSLLASVIAVKGTGHPYPERPSALSPRWQGGVWAGRSRGRKSAKSVRWGEAPVR